MDDFEGRATSELHSNITERRFWCLQPRAMPTQATRGTGGTLTTFIWRHEIYKITTLQLRSKAATLFSPVHLVLHT